jgi:hypothetical protein
MHNRKRVTRTVGKHYDEYHDPNRRDGSPGRRKRDKKPNVIEHQVNITIESGGITITPGGRLLVCMVMYDNDEMPNIYDPDDQDPPM